MLDVVKRMRAGVCPATGPALAVSETTVPERWAPTALLPSHSTLQSLPQSSPAKMGTPGLPLHTSWHNQEAPGI